MAAGFSGRTQTQMTYTCPNCASQSFTWRQRVAASVSLPKRCSNCGALVAAVPGFLLHLLYTLLHGAVFAASIGGFLLLGWWTMVVGAVLSISVLPSMMRLQSPFVVVAPSAVKTARLEQALLWAALAAGVVLAGVFSS